MYFVVSKWECIPGHEEEFLEKGLAMRKLLKRQPEVKLFESFRNGMGEVVIVMAYESEDAYKAVIQDPNGAFARAMVEHKVEEHSRWLWSERGEEEFR